MKKRLLILYLKLKSKFYKDAIIIAIDKNDNTLFTFKNGSVIKTIPSPHSDTIRGKRAEIINWSDAKDHTKDLDIILNKFKNR